MQRILVLGIGNAQVDLLQHLKREYEIEIHALSNNNIGRGLKYTDKFSCIDITKKNDVLEYCQQHKINIIYSVGSDVAMPTVAYVSEQLGLPSFISYDTALTCNNKDLFRNKLKECYGSVPFQMIEKDNVLINVPFPAIVKPVDSQGQRGVSTIYSIPELPTAFEHAIQFSRAQRVIVEKKIDGPEISVNVYIKNGELVFFLPSGRISWEQFDGGIIHKHILPCNLTNNAIINIKKLVNETLFNLEINNGPAYFQIKMCGNNPYLIEVTPRLDGCHMWRLILEATGVNLLEISIKHLLGIRIDFPYQIDVKNSSLEFICQPPNTLYKKPIIDKGYQYFESYYEDNDLVKEMNGKMEKCAYLVRMDKK